MLFKFIYRFIKCLLTYLLVCLPLEIAGYVVIPVYLLLGKNLPLWYSNFHGEGPDSIGQEVTFWNKYTWFAFRNPLNFFQYAVLGFTKDNSQVYGYRILGDPNVGDSDYPGFQSISLVDSDYKINREVAYSYYWIKVYTVFGQKKCIRFRMGHKINLGSIEEKTLQWVFTFSPYFSYTGK